MNDLIDLHTHSTASDGSDSPALLAKNASAAALRAVALTDHDTVSGLEEFLRAASELGLQAVPGVELSSALRGKEIHIIGLFIDPDASELKRFLADRRSERNLRNTQMIRKLRLAGYDITEDEVLEVAAGESAGRPHMARVLLAKGYFATMKEAFAKCLKRGTPCYVSRRHVPPQDAISAVRRAGGLAVWAHPILAAPTRSAMRRVLREIMPSGLNAMETRYSLYDAADQTAAESIAREFSLLESGGSDYHGVNQPGIALGTGTGSLAVPYSFLEKMLEKRA